MRHDDFGGGTRGGVNPYDDAGRFLPCLCVEKKEWLRIGKSNWGWKGNHVSLEHSVKSVTEDRISEKQERYVRQPCCRSRRWYRTFRRQRGS